MTIAIWLLWVWAVVVTIRHAVLEHPNANTTVRFLLIVAAVLLLLVFLALLGVVGHGPVFR